jgi:glucosamine-6-phosphate deaminase
VAEAWKIPHEQFHTVSSLEEDAVASVRGHEAKIHALGGVDVIVLGLGQNGHVGFNEPGSAPDSAGRLLDLAPTSIDANRRWFGGKYAPSKGVTTGMKTILGARRAMLLAFGPAKAAAVGSMMREPRIECPASWLQRHPHAHLIFDMAAAAGLGSAT